MSKAIYAQEEKQNTKMLHEKIGLGILMLIIPPLWVYNFFTNLDNIKSGVIFILTVIFGSVLFYYRKERMRLNNEKIDLDNSMKELEIEEKRQKMKEKEVELLERELSARITGIPKK